MTLANKIKILPATKDDISGIAKVLEDTLGQDFRFGKNSFEYEVHYLFSRAIEDRNEQVYVAKQEGEILGFAYFINKPPANGTAILEMLAVRKDKQKQGIGSKLIRVSSEMYVEQERNRGIKLRTLHLTTNANNENAQKIYRTAGYMPTGEIEGFVGEGNVEIVMLKRVSSNLCPKDYKSK